MKFFAVILLIAFNTVAHAKTWNYAGEFSLVDSNGPECAEIFNEEGYHSQFHLTGATGHTALLQFRTENKAAFFHRMVLTGLYGPNGDFEVTKEFKKGGLFYNVKVTGLADSTILTSAIKVVVSDPEQQKFICSARADYTGFTSAIF